MKLYIKSESSEWKKPEVNSIMDLFKSIDSILVVNNASEFDITLDEEEEYEYTDEELINRPVLSCYSYDTIKRIYRLAPEKLHYFKAATLGDFLATKYTLRSDELNYILEKLKQCTHVDIDRIHTKSRDFMKKYHVTEMDVLNIVHSLTSADFDCLTQSYSHANFGHDLLVFLPDREFTLENGTVISGIQIYMKIDYTTTQADGRTGVIMSIHEADSEKVKDQSGKRYPIGHLKNR